MNNVRFLHSLEKDENCNIQYEDLMNFLNFQTQPLFNLTEEDYLRIVRHAPPVKDTEVRRILYYLHCL